MDGRQPLLKHGPIQRADPPMAQTAGGLEREPEEEPLRKELNGSPDRSNHFAELDAHNLDFKDQLSTQFVRAVSPSGDFSAGRSMFAFRREPVFAQSGNRLGSLVVKSSLMEPWFGDLLL